METPLTLTIHGVTLGAILLVLGLLLKEHTAWTRLKDGVNKLCFKNCSETGRRFESLDNGK